MPADFKLLVRRLTPTATRMLEAAAGKAASNTHYEITPEHMLLAMLEQPDGDAHQILKHFDQDPRRLQQNVGRAMLSHRTGNGGRPQFSPSMLTWLEDAFMTGALYHLYSRIRSGVLLYQLIQSPGRYSADSFPELSAIDAEKLRKEMDSLLATTVEGLESAPQAGGPQEGRQAGTGEPGAPAGDSALARFCKNYTLDAKEGRIDPIFGRHREIRQMVDILSRRRKNNPIIVGEAGVGKTALVEGLAHEIVNGEVPEHLAKCDIWGLDMGLLQAGASVKGEFENRLKAVMSEVMGSPKPIILFIDEAHTIIGAGAAKGGSDAANLLKPVLARGELRTVAATTWAEYKKYFEKDAALERRFQPVKCDEPSVDGCITMLRGLRKIYEKAHKIRIQDEAIAAAAELSSRYISGRQLPDKAVDLLDMTAARVRVERAAKPEVLVDIEQQIAGLQRKEDAVRHDIDEGEEHLKDELEETLADLAKLREKRAEVLKRWEVEKEALENVIALRLELEEAKSKLVAPAAEGEKGKDGKDGKDAKTASDRAGEGAAPEAPAPADTPEITALKKKVQEASRKLEEIGGSERLLHSEVDADAIAQTVASWTGIPIGKMQRDMMSTVLHLEAKLRERVIGQEPAVLAVSETLRVATAGIRNPDQPIGVMIFVGPSGVGKTETALALADMMYGGERFMTTINMSEFQEKHTVSRLIGSPPGYVGYGEGGVLTEAVRQRPYSVVLLDECEKADIEVMELFYQVFDKGQLNDGEGREIDFKNTVIILTSNIASDVIMQCYANGADPHYDEVITKIRPVMSKHFQPALLARMRIVPYRPIDPVNMKAIARLKISKLAKRITEAHGMSVVVTEELIDEVAKRCTEAETGARNVDHILRATLTPMVARELLEVMTTTAEDQMPKSCELGIGPSGDFRIEFG